MPCQEVSRARSSERCSSKALGDPAEEPLEMPVQPVSGAEPERGPVILPELHSQGVVGGEYHGYDVVGNSLKKATLACVAKDFIGSHNACVLDLLQLWLWIGYAAPRGALAAFGHSCWPVGL